MTAKQRLSWSSYGEIFASSWSIPATNTAVQFHIVLQLESICYHTRTKKGLFMGILKLTAVALVACLLLTAAPFAMDNDSDHGDPEYGRGLAIRWCGSCHLVTADQQRSMPGAPPFATIAKSTNINGDRLARLLLAPHPKMAKPALSRTAVDHIAAYIASLKK
jgi:mono/diheme cytochrome c family protein